MPAFDSYLSFNYHMAYVCKRLRNVFCCIYGIRVLILPSVRKVIVHGLVYSVLRYGITVYGHCSESWQDKVDNIFERHAKKC